ncbi:WD40-repeat-containing domain protein [Syncephalastrum racemosum]|uniref:WD40-repeat-containing domain protein n=1 Tax=Syncephalastrum racemosum TaxID=13706 RepID=A0A1X2HXC3_SYNRA|nr:WD40-repeat-containing domain protein [Syncephalastrum racemosum]
MRAKTLEINWHDGQAVYSVDFSADGMRVATAGANTAVRLWTIKRRSLESEAYQEQVAAKKNKKGTNEVLPVHIDFLAELKRHAAPVNVVRFSPSGELLASAGDDACIIIWRKAAVKEQAFTSEYAEFEKETWSVVHMFYGHNKEIYDLAWSPCGEFLVTASIDNTARVWSLTERGQIHVLADHTHYVQGVSWDPLGQYVSTQSSDRSVAIYKYTKDGAGRLKFNTCSKRHVRLDKSKYKSKTNEAPAESEPSGRLYHDENLVTFFRRLAFSPDGGVLATPAGMYKHSEDEDGEDANNCVYLYPRNTLLRYPVAFAGNHPKPAIAIRWSHCVYARRQNKKSSQFALPYRLLYAVATQDAVYIYDTQQARPLCVLSGMHFAPITDLAWSRDGNVLAFTSADGYCSAVVFEDHELGELCAQPAFPVDNGHTQDVEMADATNTAAQSVQPAPAAASAISTPPAPTAVQKTVQAMFKIQPQEQQPTPASHATPAAAVVAQPVTPTPSPAKKRITPIPVTTEPTKKRITPIHVSSSTEQPKKRRIAPTLVSAPPKQ